MFVSVRFGSLNPGNWVFPRLGSTTTVLVSAILPGVSQSTVRCVLEGGSIGIYCIALLSNVLLCRAREIALVESYTSGQATMY